MKSKTDCRQRLVRIVFTWLAISALSAADATTLRKLSLHELVAYADEIVAAKCEKTETVWLDKKVYTIATVRVSQSAKGTTAAGGTIAVYTLGGTVQEPLPVKMHVPGAEQIATGEEMVLFLQRYGDKKQFHRVVGMSQGKLAVSTDPQTGQKSVHYDLPVKGVKWVDKDGNSVAPGTLDAREEPVEGSSLEGFLGRVHKIQAEQKAQGENSGGK